MSLKAGDEATARERWGQIHAQAEVLLKKAVEKIRSADPKITNLKKIKSLSSSELAIIAAQVRHDVLSEQDQAWIDPDFLPIVARAISCIDKNNGEKYSAEEARQVGRLVEQRNVAAMLRTGEMRP